MAQSSTPHYHEGEFLFGTKKSSMHIKEQTNACLIRGKRKFKQPVKIMHKKILNVTFKQHVLMKRLMIRKEYEELGKAVFCNQTSWNERDSDDGKNRNINYTFPPAS